MEKRRIGRSDLTISPFMLGGNVFGWTIDAEASFAVLDAFVDAGFEAIDTADVYTRFVPGHIGGESERVIGEWLKARGGRDRVVLATKLGMDMGEGKKGLSAAYMVEAVEASLRCMQTDYIDLYQSHTDDPATPMDETLEAYERLIKSGKVRAIGASNFTEPRLAEALKVSADRKTARYDSLQPLFNLCERAGFEGPMQDLCVREEIGVIPYFGLAAGFLTGKYRTEADLSKSLRGPRMAFKYLNEKGLGILAALDEVAAAHDATPGQVALAWLMAQPAIAAPIASATSVTQLKELLGATRLKLDGGQLAALNAASAGGAVVAA